MPTLSINADDLLAALRERSPQVESWLDCETGEIYQTSALFADDDVEDDPAFVSAMQQTPARFLRLPSTPAALGFQTMQAFCAQTEPALRVSLQAALQRQRAFFHFQDVLRSQPAVDARWQAFSRDATLAWAQAWLRERQILVQWQPPSDTAAQTEQATKT